MGRPSALATDADPADGTDFAFTATGDGLSGFTLDDDADGTLSDTKSFLSLDPGTDYSVTESLLAGWDLADVKCDAIGDGTSATPTDNTVAMTLGDGGSIVCTFFNEQPDIEIVKTAGDAADGETEVDLPGNVTYTAIAVFQLFGGTGFNTFDVRATGATSSTTIVNGIGGGNFLIAGDALLADNFFLEAINRYMGAKTAP